MFNNIIAPSTRMLLPMELSPNDVNTVKQIIVRAGQYLNTLYLNTVFKYIYCIYTL